MHQRFRKAGGRTSCYGAVETYSEQGNICKSEEGILVLDERNIGEINLTRFVCMLHISMIIHAVHESIQL